MADTAPITPERQALLEALSQQAASWWRRKVEGPGYLSKFDNGDRSQAGEMAQLLASMAALSSPQPSADKFERFEQLLTEALLERMLRDPMPPARDLSHLQGDRPGFTHAEMEEMRAQAAASATEDVVLDVDYGPTGVLREVAQEASVSGFPWKTTMWVCWDARPECCYVEVRAGYGRATERLPPVAGAQPQAA
ncbi:MAG: hypothetical protein ACRYFZ_19580 [Janthinobacterium lividum]